MSWLKYEQIHDFNQKKQWTMSSRNLVKINNLLPIERTTQEVRRDLESLTKIITSYSYQMQTVKLRLIIHEFHPQLPHITHTHRN